MKDVDDLGEEYTTNSNEYFFSKLESTTFMDYFCTDDFDILTFCKTKNGIKRLESLLKFCVLNVYIGNRELLHSLLDTTKIESEIEKLKIQCEILEKLSLALSDEDVLFNLSPDDCFGMLLDMIIENLHAYQSYNGTSKAMLKLKKNDKEFLDSAAISVFDVTFLNTTDGLTTGICSQGKDDTIDLGRVNFTQKLDDTDRGKIQKIPVSSSIEYRGIYDNKDSRDTLIISIKNDILAYVYDIFSTILNCDDSTVMHGLPKYKCKLRRSIVNKRINSNCISSLLNQLMTSSNDNNAVERELCKYALVDLINRRSVCQTFYSTLNNSILKCIYCNINIESFTIRRDSNQVYLMENTQEGYVTLGGIRDVLWVLKRFVSKSFHDPLRRYEREFLYNTLIPLHKTIYLPAIVDLVTDCIIEIVNIDPSILQRYVYAVLNKVWPYRSSIKQVCMLYEIKALILVSYKFDNVDVLKLLFRKISNLLTSQHFQISLEYHSIFEILEYVKILEEHKEELCIKK
eukprot:g5054.t1